MKGDLFFEYIANDFNKYLEENQIPKPIILFLDGHRSHMTLPLSEFCDKNGIILHALQSNSTHILQPADVSVFKPLKLEWQKTVRKWQRLPENSNITVNKMNFCKVFQTTLENYEMENHIIIGFRKCGLYPLNPDNVGVQNFIEKQNETNVPVNVSVSNKEFKAAEKVIHLLRERLSFKEIGADIILNEMKCF